MRALRSTDEYQVQHSFRLPLRVKERDLRAIHAHLQKSGPVTIALVDTNPDGGKEVHDLGELSDVFQVERIRAVEFRSPTIYVRLRDRHLQTAVVATRGEADLELVSTIRRLIARTRALTLLLVSPFLAGGILLTFLLAQFVAPLVAERETKQSSAVPSAAKPPARSSGAPLESAPPAARAPREAPPKSAPSWLAGVVTGALLAALGAAALWALGKLARFAIEIYSRVAPAVWFDLESMAKIYLVHWPTRMLVLALEVVSAVSSWPALPTLFANLWS